MKKTVYFKLLIQPLVNFQGCFSLLVFIVSGIIVVFFLFFNASYKEVFVNELKGIYPMVFIEHAKLDLIQDVLKAKAVAELEAFHKKVHLDIYLDSKKKIRTWSGIRAFDFTNPKLTGQLPSYRKKKDCLWISSSMFNLLYPDQDINEYCPGSKSISFECFDGLKKQVKIAGICRLMNKERWIIFDFNFFQNLNLSDRTNHVVSIYHPSYSGDPYPIVKESIGGFPYFYRWFERQPFFYKYFWQIFQNYFIAIGFIMVSIMLILFWNNIQMTSTELKNSIFLVDFYGVPQKKILIWSLLMNVFFLTPIVIIILGVPFLTVGIINLPDYNISLHAYALFFKTWVMKGYDHPFILILILIQFFFPALFLNYVTFYRAKKM